MALLDLRENPEFKKLMAAVFEGFLEKVDDQLCAWFLKNTITQTQRMFPSIATGERRTVCPASHATSPRSRRLTQPALARRPSPLTSSPLTPHTVHYRTGALPFKVHAAEGAAQTTAQKGITRDLTTPGHPLERAISLCNEAQNKWTADKKDTACHSIAKLVFMVGEAFTNAFPEKVCTLKPSPLKLCVTRHAVTPHTVCPASHHLLRDASRERCASRVSLSPLQLLTSAPSPCALRSTSTLSSMLNQQTDSTVGSPPPLTCSSRWPGGC